MSQRARRHDHSRGIILFSAQDYWYHNRAHSDVQLARALSVDQPVLLVNSLGMRMPRRGTTTQPLRRMRRKAASVLRAVRRPEKRHPHLFVLSPLSVPAYSNARIRSWNASFVALQVRVVSRLLKLGRPDLLVTLPTAWEVARRIPSRSTVVNRSDRYSALPEADTVLIASMEREMLKACDAAVYVSRELMDEEQSLVEDGRGRAVFLGHGVDLEHFSVDHRRAEPDDLAGIPYPRIGFFGGIDDYVVDLDLIKRMALELPEASVVLIGDATCDMDDLTSLENVFWLGMKSYEQIPVYGAGFDVAIMPWMANDWIRFCNPIKTKEYLALGLPVITMYYPAAETHRDVLGIARNSSEFIDLVRDALDGAAVGTSETRRASVAGDTWSARAESLREVFAVGDR